MNLILLFFLLIIDIITKKIIFSYVELNTFIKLTSFFDIAHIQNHGVAFGFFSKVLSTNIIVFISLIIAAVLIYLYFKSSNIYEKWAYFFIIAGAFSNIIDRFFNSYVLDFLYFNYNNYSWPAFNFADIYISIGIFIILISIFQNKNKKEE